MWLRRFRDATGRDHLADGIRDRWKCSCGVKGRLGLDGWDVHRDAAGATS